MLLLPVFAQEQHNCHAAVQVAVGYTGSAVHVPLLKLQVFLKEYSRPRRLGGRAAETVLCFGLAVVSAELTSS